MTQGKPFEVSKDVFDRAKAQCKDKDRKSYGNLSFSVVD